MQSPLRSPYRYVGTYVHHSLPDVCMYVALIYHVRFGVAGEKFLVQWWEFFCPLEISQFLLCKELLTSKSISVVH